MSDHRRPPISLWFIPLLIGVIGFYRVTQSANFEVYRSVDIVQFLGSGMCFGVTLVGIIFTLRGPRS